MRSPTAAPKCSRLAALLVATFALAATAPAAAQTCFPNQCGYSSCHTPAKGVISSLWGDLAPTDNGQLPASRDNSDFKQIVGSWVENPYWMSVDPENGYVFAVASQRFQIWDARSNPGQPALQGDVSLPNMGLTWGFDAHAFIIFQDVDAPPNRDDLVAMVGENGVGLVVWNTANKANPSILYQDHGPGSPPQREANQVYATTLNGRHYAFVAASSDGGGLHVYDLSTAQQLSSRCTEGQPGGASPCPGVYLRQIGSRTVANYVDGVGNFVVVSSGGNPNGFQIWNVANPNLPQLVMEALPTEPTYGVALWQQGGNYYLGLRTANQGRIYNVSCIAGGSCSLGSPLWSQTMPFSVSGMITYSTSGGTPFLYFGLGEDCLSGNQNEWLFNVASPSSPQDISPQGTVQDNGEQVSYWGWYYRRNGVHGFNFMAPRMGKFAGDYFYRAAKSIFDIHRRTGGSPPVANFSWSPAEVYPDSPVTFTDTSTGAPNAWSWSFAPDGSPSSSSQQHPAGVTFPTTGTKTVTLTSSNAAGTSDPPKTQTLTVLPPQPNVGGGVSASPNPALLCQPVTFTALNVTGKPPLTFAWQVRNSDNQTVDSGGNVNPFVWTTASTLAAGNYTAEVTVTNTSGSTSASRTVAILALPPLPGASTFTPTYDGAPSPPATGTVQFHVTATGATEWSWDFGDGSGYGPWSSDPVTGPNPSHTYSVATTYNVRVRVRNCVEPLVESASVSVQITNIEPLEAQFAASGLFCSGGACFGDVNQAIAFLDQSTGPPDRWDYDWDGNGSFEDQNRTSPATTHTYTAAGTFSPKLRVWRGPEVSDIFTHAPITIGGGGGGGGNPSISISGPSSGNVNASLTFSANALNCTPGATGWTWTLGSGTASGSTTGQTITISWSTSGSKTITAKNSSCGTTTGTKSVNINTTGGGGGGTLNAVFTISPASPTAGQTVTFNGTGSTGTPTIYSWDFGDGSTATGSTATHVFSSAGTYSVKLEVSRTSDPTCPPFNICVDTETKSLVVIASGPTASFNANVPCIGGVCTVTAGQRVSFNDTSTGTVTSRLWDFGDGTTATSATPTHTWQNAGVFTVRLTVSNGAESNSTARVFQVNPPPIAAAFTVNVPCVGGICTVLRGQKVTFTDTSTGTITSRQWDFGDGTTSTLAAPMHSWDEAGRFTVVLSVNNGSLEDEATLDFQVNLPPIEAAFEVNDIECAETCTVATGEEVSFTDSSTGEITTWSWDFGDGTTSDEPSPTHAWNEPGDYQVVLTVGDGDQESEASLDFTVVGPPPGANRVLLPWVVQGQAALDQVSTLYLHNPDSESRVFNVRFFKRPSQVEAPPEVPVQLNPGATAYFADVLQALFDVDNASGYLEIEPSEPAALPAVVIGFHRTFQDDGTSFGQSVPGVSMLQLPKADSADRLHLVGLNDNADRFSFFGVTNPGESPVGFQLHFFNRRGDRIGTPVQEPLTVARRGQRQFQLSQLRNTFGISSEVDYRVEIELLAGEGQIYPYGTNLRSGTEDPSFVRTGEFDASTVFLIGALAAQGLNETQWRTDALLVNIADEALRTEIEFVNVGNTSEPLDRVAVTLLPGESKRLENVLVDRWGEEVDGSLGVLRFDTTSASGVYPIIHGETYDNADPTRRFGQFMPALTSKDVAQAGQRQILVGLQQDANSRTTVWLYNPGENAAEYDLVYRGLNGAELGVVEGVRLRGGRMRQISPAQHPLPAEGVADGFTIQVIVRDGSLLSAAQVVSNDTNDPAFVPGVTR